MARRPSLNVGFEMPVALNQGDAKRGQGRSPAAASAGAGRDYTLAEGLVQALEQLPRAPVTHSEIASGLGQGAAGRNLLQQRDLSGPDRATAPEVDAKSDRQA